MFRNKYYSRPAFESWCIFKKTFSQVYLFKFPHLTHFEDLQPLIMSYIKPTFLYLAILFASHVYATGPPSTPDQFLNNNLATNALPLTTDYSDSGSLGNSSLEAGVAATRCIEKGPTMRDKYRPRYTDCAKAFRRLPSTTDIKSFCSSPGASCRLPAGATVGNCRVTITLEGAYKEMTSWAEIGLAATQLNTACLADEKSAGSTLAGPNDRIQITISKVRD